MYTHNIATIVLGLGSNPCKCHLSNICLSFDLKQLKGLIRDISLLCCRGNNYLNVSYQVQTKRNFLKENVILCSVHQMCTGVEWLIGSA